MEDRIRPQALAATMLHRGTPPRTDPARGLMVPREEEGLLPSQVHLAGMVDMVRLHSLELLPPSLDLIPGLGMAQAMVEGTAVEDMGDPHLPSLVVMQEVLVASDPLEVQEGSEARPSRLGSPGLIHTRVSRVDILASTMDTMDIRVDRHSLGLLVGGEC